MLKTIYDGSKLLTCRVGQGSVIKYMYLKQNIATSMVGNHILLLFKIAIHQGNRLSSKAIPCRNGLFSTQAAMLMLMLSINTAIPTRIIVLISLLHATLNNSLPLERVYKRPEHRQHAPALAEQENPASHEYAEKTPTAHARGHRASPAIRRQVRVG